jgi:iron(III) transport system permease protein
VTSLGISKRCSTEGIAHSRAIPTVRLPRTEAVVGVGVSLVVALLVLPPLAAVVLAGTGSGFAPLHHPDVVLNTLVFGLLTTLCAMLLGGGLALSLAPGVPGRVLLERLVVMPLYLTPLLTAMGWSWLASPRSGLVNLLLHAAFSARVTINVVSAPGAIVVTALAAAPLPFLLLSDALRALDPALLEAARVHGAMPRLVFRRIILPLLLPAALASAVLVFVQAIGMFSVPAVLGMPAGFNVATTEIYQSLESYPPRTADATAWGVLLLAITAFVTFAQAAVLGRRSFVTITGKAFRPNQHPPPARRLRAGMAWFYVALATVLPLIALLWAASSAFITADIRLMRFTPQHFAYVLRDYPKTWLAAGNSLLLGILTASLVSLLGLAVSWIVLRTRHRGRSLLDQLSMVPLSMPAMVFALGLLWVYVRVPLPIYGTIAILLIAYATHYLPFGVRATSAALRQLHPELEEAARVAGASWLRTMRKITLPLVQPAMLAAWVLLFVMSMQEVSSSILLYSSHSIVLSVAVFDLWENGNPGDVAALGFLQLIVSSVIVGVVLGIRHRRGFA